MEDLEALLIKLESLGESEVRAMLANGYFGERKKPLVEEWLRSLEAARISASSSERSEFEERALSIAEEANSIARETKAISERALAELRSTRRIATSAIILSIIMATYKIMEIYQII